MTEIDGQNVHFAHVRSADPAAVPLLLTHGWPSTFADFAGIVEPLVTGDPAFHLVAPSLPGFGFSGPTRERGWDVRRIARAWAELMHRLGYERYVVQGGDFGSLISPEVARVAPEHVAGVRLYNEAGSAFYGGNRVEVPTAVAVFPGDGALRALAERSLSVVRWTEYERGGHFASLQAPDLLVADIQAFVRGLQQ